MWHEAKLHGTTGVKTDRVNMGKERKRAGKHDQGKREGKHETMGPGGGRGGASLTWGCTCANDPEDASNEIL